MQLYMNTLAIEAETLKWILIGILIFVVIALIWFLSQWKDFRRELRFVNMEIQRNTGRERERWIKKKKRLLLSLIPFFHY